ncbi:hypothetical protein WG68_08570 [Arsukibacterium ikkense]|uniref:Uncharacterized protein n=1 Tax=Arsukibacterium ikkense TaxID=336831 RepID=A0A0M2V7Y3_9GAMM|nr:DUF5677 domain-containing protein [Arsukibacterium ikkense]KKO45760.1 hypothetical protein WG68_08570 [Arsukibacterium ikkense]
MKVDFGSIQRALESDDRLDDTSEANVFRVLHSVAEDLLAKKSLEICHLTDSRASFRLRLLDKWGETFDLFELFISIYLDVASSYRKAILTTSDSQDLRFPALTQIHAKSVLVLREIQSLVEAGFPDGALARWRTLHELAVCSCVIAESESSARRYILSEHIKNEKGAQSLSKHAERLKHKPFSVDQMADISRLKECALKELGDDFDEYCDYEWAKPYLEAQDLNINRNRFNLHTLEVATGLDHYRPYFMLACEKIHAPSKSNYASLALANQTGLVVGPSSSGLLTPIDLAMLSSSIIVTKFLLLFPALDSSVFLTMLRITQEKTLNSAAIAHNNNPLQML